MLVNEFTGDGELERAGRSLGWCCRVVGLSSAPFLGSTDGEGSQTIGRTSIARRSHSCVSPQFTSCSKNFVIPFDVSGQSRRQSY